MRFWEEIEHTADWALRVWGEDRLALFENAARGMASLTGAIVEPGGEGEIHRTITLQASDWETLLIRWLSELLVLMEDEAVAFSTIRVCELRDYKLEAEVRGRSGSELDKLIKAATFHNLSIRQTERGYETTIVFDV